MLTKNILTTFFLLAFTLSPRQVEIFTESEICPISEVIIRFDGNKEVRLWLNGRIQPSLPFVAEIDKMTPALQELALDDSLNGFLIKFCLVDDCCKNHNKDKGCWYPMDKLQSKIEDIADYLGEISEMNQLFEADDGELVAPLKLRPIRSEADEGNREYLSVLKLALEPHKMLYEIFEVSGICAFWFVVDCNTKNRNDTMRAKAASARAA